LANEGEWLPAALNWDAIRFLPNGPGFKREAAPRNDSPRTQSARGRYARDSRADAVAAQLDPARGLVSCNPDLKDPRDCHAN
jgi:hypothetical protein